MESKVKSTGGSFEMKGGKNHMVGPQHAGPQVPGVSGTKTSGDGGKFISGGHGNHMVGLQHAGPQVPGVAETKTSGDGGKYAKGGNTHMFGKQTAKTATPA